MPQLPTPMLEDFARLIALGWPTTLAAKGAGYGIRRASRAAARLAQPGVSARVAELKRPEPAETKAKAGRTVADREDGAEEVVKVERPPLPPPMTEEEWMAEFAPHLLEKWRAQNKG